MTYFVIISIVIGGVFLNTITLVDFICYSSLAFMAYHYIKVLKLQKVGDFNSKEYHHYLFSFIFFQAISYLN